jgi:hypothetical protein
MNFVRSACPPRSISRLRACWGASAWIMGRVF